MIRRQPLDPRGSRGRGWLVVSVWLVFSGVDGGGGRWTAKQLFFTTLHQIRSPAFMTGKGFSNRDVRLQDALLMTALVSAPENDQTGRLSFHPFLMAMTRPVPAA